jgi:hypothetical protein
MDSAGFGKDEFVGYFEHGNESSGFIKKGNLLKQIRDYYILKKKSVAWTWSRITAKSKARDWYVCHQDYFAVWRTVC